METYSEVILKSSLILVVFYLSYVLLLSSETSFRQNRIFLLSGLLISLFIPFIQFPVSVDYLPLSVIRLKTVEILSSGNPALAQSSYLSAVNILIVIYFTGVLALILKFSHQLWILSKFFKNSSIVEKPFGKIVYTGKRHPVFSFLNYVFVDSQSETSNELEVILEHERVHIVQLHSIDLLLLEVLAIVQWFNPLVWLYLKSIKQNHEYLADQGVIKCGFSVDAYQYLLLNNYSALQLGFANSFNHSLTFKRLVMMKKISSKKLSAIKLMIVIPMALMAVYLVSCSKDPNSNKVLNTDSKEVKTTTVPDNKIGSEMDVYESYAIQVKPAFPGGDEALMKYVAENTKYPKEALEKNIEGTVYVRFVVNKNGKVENAKELRSVDPFLEAEALRVVSSLPAWKPGMNKGKPVNVWFIMPVKFKLQ